MKILSKLRKHIGKNRQLLIGLLIGVVVMLPTGMYISARNNTSQKQQSVSKPTNVKEQEPAVIDVDQPPQAPAPEPVPPQALPAPKKSGVDCVSLNNVQQTLINESENSNYQTYLRLKQILESDTTETPELKELNITHEHNKYQTAVNRQRDLAVNIITGAKCMPTVSVALRSR